MKHREIEKIKPILPDKLGKVTTVSHADSNLIVLDYWENKRNIGRYALDFIQNDYGCKINGKWTNKKLMNLYGFKYESEYTAYDFLRERYISKKTEDMLHEILKEKTYCKNDEAYRIINTLETNISREKRGKAEKRHIANVEAMMDRVPEEPADIGEWAFSLINNEDYALLKKETNSYTCTMCGQETKESDMKRADGGSKIRHNDIIICPHCKKQITFKRRNASISKRFNFMVLQSIDNEVSVARHYACDISFYPGKKHDIWHNEYIRLIMSKEQNFTKIYYKAWSRWDDRKTYGMHTVSGYCYPNGIREALMGTSYEKVTRLFEAAAAGKMKMQYNKIMSLHPNHYPVFEYLYKGRFYRLLKEESEYIYPVTGRYYGTLNIDEQDINEVFYLADTQKINLIRELNGGTKILKWMRVFDETDEKVNKITLEWLCNNNIEKYDVKFIMDRMTLTQIMHYVIKQQTTCYKGKTTKSVLSQWEDYLSMCNWEKKNVNDEMVYRPRDLKLRHNEMVEARNRRDIIENMKNNEKYARQQEQIFNDKYPIAGQILNEIKAKYEYTGEQYMIKVPDRLSDIVLEGQALHHCAGSTDRYFDRIQSRETYICFLRKTEFPDVPYYTIEVEPSGTIRQHRGMFDEEPEIELIKPFLREWQKEVRSRLSKKDMEHAKRSAELRVKNIEELRQKNNLRVLKALEQDFMEAEVI